MTSKKSSSDSSSGQGRTRNFASILYPESAPSDWLSILADQFVPAFVSPLHNLDFNPTGEAKKPHHHIILMFDSVKTVDQAREVFELIGSVGCEKVKSIRAYSRYLCHLDNPDKAPYNPSDVICLGGSVYDDVALSDADRIDTLTEIMYFIDCNNIRSYSELCRYCSTHNKAWFRLIVSNYTLAITQYIKSNYWENTTLKGGSDE